MLLGRAQERHEIEQALARARSGTSATLALVGDPGIGKTALLDYAAGRATGMRVLRARGIKSEAQIPFGSLLELLRPALAMLDKIPEPQAVALEGALALRRGTAQERFAVGAATLSMLAAYAEQAPVAVLVDDAQWLDVSSAQALLFAFRRLVADPIAVFVAVREGELSLLDGADLPALQISGLTSDEAAQLMPGLTAETAALLHRATAGNPLALLELAADPGDLTLAPEGAPVLVSAKISQAFLHRAGQLSQAAQQALVLAAASDTSDLATLRAGRVRARDRPGRAGRRRERRTGHAAPWHGGVPPSAGQAGDLHRRARPPAARCAPGTGGRAAGSRRGPSRLASGRRGGGHGRVGVGCAGAGWRPGQGPQCVRGRGRGL